jgi:hypothetical protein
LKALFATGLLANVPRALLYRLAEGIVNARDRVLLHAGQNIAVEIKGYADARVSEPLGRDLGVDAAGQEMRGVRVPEIMEPSAGGGGAADRFAPCLRQAARLQGLAVLLCVDERCLGLPDVQLQQLLGLAEAVLT